MGISVSVYRHGKYDCTNGGISSKFDQLTIVNAEGPFDPDEKAPAAILIESHGNAVIRPAVFDKATGEYVVEPNKWFMFGGNFAYTSDSRFREAVEKVCGRRFYGAVPIHDRCEE